METDISFRSSKWQRFDPEFAERIRTEHPDIWKLGGNIRGNDQYRKLYPITQRNGVPNSETEVNALKLREAWVARHYEDFRIAGVIAQIKWLAVGSRGEKYMKDLVNEEIKKRADRAEHSDFELDSYLEHYGIKGMRWGVRRSDKQLAKERASSRTSYKKGPKELSSAELKRRVSRMETEKRYIELNPTTESGNKGESFTNKYVSSLKGTTAKRLAGATVAIGAAALGAKYGEKVTTTAIDLAKKLPG